MEALLVELRGVGGVGLGAVGGVVVCVDGGAGVRGVVDVGGGVLVVVLVLAVLLVVMAPLVRLWFKDRCMAGCWGVCAVCIGVGAAIGVGVGVGVGVFVENRVTKKVTFPVPTKGNFFLYCKCRRRTG